MASDERLYRMERMNKECNGSNSDESHNVPTGRTLRHAKIRRLFSFPQIFAFTLTYMSTWEGMCTNLYFALYEGGPQVWVWSYVLVYSGAMCQAASLAEMASILPIAGAQYHWTYNLAPKKIRRFTAYLQGWITWFGFIALLAGIANVTVMLFNGILTINAPERQLVGWEVALAIIVLCIAQGFMNTYAFRLVPWLEMISGVLHVCLFVVFVVVLGVMGHRNGAKWIFTATHYNRKWDDGHFVPWNLGMLTCVWSFTGMDGAIHMSEEVRKAKMAVPRGMFWSLLVNGIFGFIMVIMILQSIHNIDGILAIPQPIVPVLKEATGSDAAATAMLTGLFVIGFSITIASIASTSRLTWAWSRDGGLPKSLAQIHPKHHVPVRAVWLVVSVVCLLSLLNVGSSVMVAFGAITSLSSLALYLSYAIAILSMLYARYLSPVPLKLGDWNLGKWGGPINMFAVVYTMYVIIWLPFPQDLGPHPSAMNYSSAVMGACLIAVLFMWIVRGRKHWEGPNVSIMDFVAAHS